MRRGASAWEWTQEKSVWGGGGAGLSVSPQLPVISFPAALMEEIGPRLSPATGVLLML